MGKLLPIPLDEVRRSKLRKRAAEMTLATGEPYNMTKLILEAVDASLEATDTATSSGPKAEGAMITFKPAPEVSQAIKRARLNSGESTDKVINALISEALQLETSA
jgi:hypothetical protein